MYIVEYYFYMYIGLKILFGEKGQNFLCLRQTLVRKEYSI